MRLLLKLIFATCLLIIVGVSYAIVVGFPMLHTPDGGQVELKRATVRIPDVNFLARVEVAQTPEQRRLGLSGRPPLAADSGMLFVFDHSDYHRIWMKDMLFGIDCIWIAGGQVIDVTHRLGVPEPGTPDESIAIYQPREAVPLVLEVPDGTAAAFGIAPGLRVDIAFDEEEKPW
ncbi:MAG: DUF192 domain-containing protein [Candidatus Uhrbacteria bacterium]